MTFDGTPWPVAAAVVGSIVWTVAMGLAGLVCIFAEFTREG